MARRSTWAILSPVMFLSVTGQAQRVTAPASDAVSEPFLSGATGFSVQHMHFAPGSDVDGAQLIVIPGTMQARVNRVLAFDAYAAWAVGSVTAGGRSYHLTGPSDTWLRLRWAALPWVVIAGSVSLPTGMDEHDPNQAVVANVLSNDLLGFREGNWGDGGSATLGMTAVRTLGSTNLTVGTSYRASRRYAPDADTSIRYAPGSEFRARVSADRIFGGGRVTVGMTTQHFAADRAEGRNLFQAGQRNRGDLTYASDTWQLFAVDLWRAKSDMTVPIIDASTALRLSDTTFEIGWQNLIVMGASHVASLRDNLFLVPSAQLKVQERAGRAGRGWIGTVGVGLPYQRGPIEYFPTVAIDRGSLIPTLDRTKSRAVWGTSVGLVVRRTARQRTM